MSMNQKMISAIESHPALGWVASVLSIGTGMFRWLFDHVDDFTKLLGLAATVFGLVAGYYTMRIQRRTWNRKNGRDSQG